MNRVLGIIICIIIFIIGNGILYKYKDDVAAGMEDFAGISAIVISIIGILVCIGGSF